MNNYNIDELMALTKSGKADDLLSRLSKSDADKIKSVLSDKAATEKLLQTTQAQEILRYLKKDGKI